MIPAFQKDDRLIQDIQQADDTRLHLWWLGQSGYLVKWGTFHLLIDPYLSDSLTKKYVTTDKPHTRMSELVLDPARLDYIDVVTSSHNHTDHLDGETLIPLLKANPNIQFVIPEANRAFVVNRVGCSNEFPIGMNAGESTEISELRIHAVPAAHEALEMDDEGRHKFLGYVFSIGPWTIYHSGDTMLFEGIEDLLRPFDIDIALLPINGRAPERRVAGNLNAREAVDLGLAIGAKWVIPCHYDMFTFNTADPMEFVEYAKAKGQGYQVLHGGEGWSPG